MQSWENTALLKKKKKKKIRIAYLHSLESDILMTFIAINKNGGWFNKLDNFSVVMKFS